MKKLLIPIIILVLCTGFVLFYFLSVEKESQTDWKWLVGISISLISIYYAYIQNRKLKSSAASATRRITTISETSDQLLDLIKKKQDQVKSSGQADLSIIEIFDTFGEVTKCLKRDVKDSIKDWENILDYDKYKSKVNEAINEASPRFVELVDKVEELSEKNQKDEKEKERLEKAKAEVREQLMQLSKTIAGLKEKYNSPLVGNTFTGATGTTGPIGPGNLAARALNEFVDNPTAPLYRSIYGSEKCAICGDLLSPLSHSTCTKCCRQVCENCVDTEKSKTLVKICKDCGSRKDTTGTAVIAD